MMPNFFEEQAKFLQQGVNLSQKMFITGFVAMASMGLSLLYPIRDRCSVVVSADEKGSLHVVCYLNVGRT